MQIHEKLKIKLKILKKYCILAVYEPEETGPEEPAVCFVPLGSSQFEGDLLEQSMLLLGDGLASGNALKQYETLLRRLPEESSAVSKLPQNVAKNRYRDIAPCKYVSLFGILNYIYFFAVVMSTRSALRRQ